MTTSQLPSVILSLLPSTSDSVSCVDDLNDEIRRLQGYQRGFQALMSALCPLPCFGTFQPAGTWKMCAL